MFRRHEQEHAPLSLGHTEPDTALRDEVDPDPVVEEATARLRDQLLGLEAVDAWGRPVAWRQVARIALGPLATSRVRDAMTADVIERSVSPDETDRTTEWRTQFRAVDETDQQTADQSGVLPEI
jgi:hypothetical protein